VPDLRYMLPITALLALVGCEPGSSPEVSTSSQAAADAGPTPAGPGDMHPVLTPAEYYAGIDADAAGADLKRALHELIDDHTELFYRQLWDALAYTDADPDRDGHVLLFYTGWSRSADLHGGSASEWNREHVWAKSHGDLGTAPPAGTDLHHIRATDVTVNNARGSLAFDDGGTLYTDNDGPTTCRRDDDSWEPRDEVKGDVARILFYMAVRYETGDPQDLELVEGVQPPGDKSPVLGVLSTLLAWHAADPPDDAERLRNGRVQELQGNRNPFIDHPEWVDRVWGGVSAD